MKLNPGEALAIRTVNAERKSYNDFLWPESGEVVCPDWDPAPECGHGLHGLLDGIGDYSLLSSDQTAVWQVVKVARADCVAIGDKVKFPRCEVVFSGCLAGALCLISRCWIAVCLADKNGAVTTGTCANAATTGNYANAATTGNYANAATTGNCANAATTGTCANAATTGNYANAATTGSKTVSAALGRGGNAMAGPGGVLVVGYWDAAADRPRVAVGYVGEAGIKATTWYRADESGKLEEVL